MLIIPHYPSQFKRLADSCQSSVPPPLPGSVDPALREEQVADTLHQTVHQDHPQADGTEHEQGDYAASVVIDHVITSPSTKSVPPGGSNLLIEALSLQICEIVRS